MVPCRWPSLAGAFLLEQLTCVRCADAEMLEVNVKMLSTQTEILEEKTQLLARWVRMLRIVAIVRKSVTYTLHFFNALAAESALLLQRRDASKTVRGL